MSTAFSESLRPISLQIIYAIILSQSSSVFESGSSLNTIIFETSNCWLPVASWTNFGVPISYLTQY